MRNELFNLCAYTLKKKKKELKKLFANSTLFFAYRFKIPVETISSEENTKIPKTCAVFVKNPV